MYFFYIFALLPILIGGILWYKNKQIILYEWLIGAGVALFMAFIFNMITLGVIHGKTKDIETWSGQITLGKHFASWREYYQEAIYKTEYYTTTESYTDSNGKRKTRSVRKSRRVFSHWEDRRRWHNEYWKAYSSLNTSYSITKDQFEYLVTKFGNKTTVKGDRRTSEHNSRMIDGDPNDYEARNVTGWIEPVTIQTSFENKIKATPNLFQFTKVPTNISVYPWPSNPGWNISGRLLGTASVLIDSLAFDQLNAKLGPLKKVNLIMVGFGNKDSSFGEYQEAAWIGGKKNDLVICFGGGSKAKPAQWVKVFGWTERELVKKNLETLLLSQAINDDLLPLMEAEIKQHYQIKDWKKFDYIRINPPGYIYGWYIFLVISVQCGIYIFCHRNDMEKNWLNR